MKIDDDRINSLPSSLQKKLHEIINDTTNGSTIILEDTINLLTQLLSNKFRGSIEIIVPLLLSICNTHSSMAVLINFSNEMFKYLNKEKIKKVKESKSKEIILHFLNDYQKDLYQSDKKIKDHSFLHLQKYRKIALYSSSGTVKKCIQHLQKKEKNLLIICSECRPKNEGTSQAVQLAQNDIQTILMTDASLFSSIKKVDCIIVGADAITSNGIINKMGTYPLALLASLFHIPFYCLTKTNKILPYKYQLPDEKEKSSKDLINKKYELLKIENYYFDTTPLNLVTGIITEKEFLDTKRIKNMMESKNIHPKLKNL